MPFGTFRVEERDPIPPRSPRPVREKMPKPATPPTPAVQPANHFAGDRVNILLVGRNLSITREFLCSMNQNMTQALQEEGLAYYTQELKAISDMTARKKQLEQFFWSFSQADWVYPADESGEEIYRFSLSPAGNQSCVLELVFRCVTPRAENPAPDQADAVWLLTDGLFLEEGEDPYTGFLQGLLSSLAQSGGDKPVCLVLSQIEGLGRFDSLGSQVRLSRKVSARLDQLCRDRFLGACGTQLRPALIPVQLYGGLECSGRDQKGDPLLRIGQSGFYQSYIPENCQIPGLYTLQTIMAARQQDFFPDNGLAHGIQQHYSLRFANAGWRPQLLGREEES